MLQLFHSLCLRAPCWGVMRNFVVLGRGTSGLGSCDNGTQALNALHLMYLGEVATFLPFIAVMIAALSSVSLWDHENVVLVTGIVATIVWSYLSVFILLLMNGLVSSSVVTTWSVVLGCLSVQGGMAVFVFSKIREWIAKELSTSANEKENIPFASHNQTYYYHYLLLFSSRKRIMSLWLMGSWVTYIVTDTIFLVLSRGSLVGLIHPTIVSMAEAVFPPHVLYFIVFGICYLSRLVFGYICANYGYELGHTSIYELEAQNAAHVDRRAFLRYVFHEVRVPLNSISLGLELLAESDMIVNDDKETVIMMREAITFMGETLNDVLAIQKVEEGALKLIFKPFDIGDLLNVSIQPYLEISHSKRLNIISTIDSDVCRTVVGDKYRLKHVLMNIISNAVKYSYPDSEVHVVVTDEGPVSKITETVQAAIARLSTSSPRNSSMSSASGSHHAVSASSDLSSPASSGKSMSNSSGRGAVQAPPSTTTVRVPSPTGASGHFHAHPPLLPMGHSKSAPPEPHPHHQNLHNLLTRSHSSSHIAAAAAGSGPVSPTASATSGPLNFTTLAAHSTDVSHKFAFTPRDHMMTGGSI